MMNITTIKRAFDRHQRFILLAHVSPDPDALCSQLALARFLRANGKTVSVMTDAPLPRRFALIPDVQRIQIFDARKKINFEAAIILDCGEITRVGSVHRALVGKFIINIDHHVTNDRFGQVNLVDLSASSTCELLYLLFKRLDYRMDRTTAWLLYAGMMTDTGSFRYENTTEQTHQVAAELMRFKLPVAEMYRYFYERVALNDLQLFLKIVGKFEPAADGRIIWLTLQEKQIEAFSDDFDLRDALFHQLRTIETAEIIIILTAEGKNRTKVNFRSMKTYDVARLAASLGGGGHKRASGCTVSAGLKDARRMVEQRLKRI